VKTQERTQVKFEGMLGRMAGMFGGKAAKEGIVSTEAFKGDRKLTSSGDTGEIVDLAEEKLYRLDFKDKSYTVVTFEELRRQLKEAQEKAKQQAQQAQGKAEEPAKGDQPQVEVDFDLKETGQKRTIAGYEAREVVMTITVREKGKTLEQAGGMVLVGNNWLGPEIPELQEKMAFERKYAQKVYGELVSVEAMQQMAAAMAMYPGMQDAIARMGKESGKLSGTPLLTVMTFQMVKSEQQMTAEKDQEGGSAPPTGLGGLMGGLGRKMAKKKEEPQAAGGAANRATILTMTTELLNVATAVAAADVALPAGLKLKK
jgi:hypothetical protein